MVNLPVNAFLVGANRKLGNTSECLLLSEIYMRGKESSSFVISRDYVEKVLGIKRTSQNNYYNKFIDLKLCKVETSGSRRVITPNMGAITKFIEDGTEELREDLDTSKVAYEVKGEVDKPKKREVKKTEQRTLLKTTFKSRIDYEYLIDSPVVKTYKNLRAKGTTFTGKDGINYSLMKLDDALKTSNFDNITAKDLSIYLSIIYEQYYKKPYPQSNRDVANMNKFLTMNKLSKADAVDWFICFIERYEELGYASTKYPRFNIWVLTVQWVVDGLMANKGKTSKGSREAKKDGVTRWDDVREPGSVDLYTESDEEF